MKIATFFISLFFLLIGGKDYSYAVNHHSDITYFSNKTFAKELKTRFIIEDLSIIVIDDTDTDFDEDHLSKDDVKDNSDNKLFFEKKNFQYVWFLPKYRLRTLNSCNSHFKIFSHFCGYSYPIYISQRALRI